MKLLKLSVIALTAGLAVGCASTSDVADLQKRVSGLEAGITGATNDAAAAKASAADAAAKASAAEAAANRAANTADEVNTKLDRMFKHSMMK